MSKELDELLNGHAPETKKRETKAEREQRRLDERMQSLHAMRGRAEELDVRGYVYRKTWQGRPVALPPVEQFLLDDDIGLLYGPGEYVATYFDTETNQNIGTMRYSIGAEYAELHRQACQIEGRPCYLDGSASIPGQQRPAGFNIAELLDKDKLQGMAAFLGTLKMVLAPGNDKALEMVMSQQTALMQSMQNRGPNVSDAIATEALRMIGAERKAEKTSLKDQLEIFREVQGIIQPEIMEAREAKEEVAAMSPMERTINKALDALPALLEQFGGNVKQAADHTRKANPLEAALLKGSPKLQREFYSQCVSRYGQAMADQWAVSYGINPANLLPSNKSQNPAAQSGSLRFL
jgi:hypothetical protein